MKTLLPMLVVTFALTAIVLIVFFRTPALGNFFLGLDEKKLEGVTINDPQIKITW